jgi:ferredoxin
MFSGKIKGLECARLLGRVEDPIPEDWYQTAAVLKSHPGQITREWLPDKEEGVFPVLHCSQEIPCNPCTSVCSQGLIKIDESDIRKVPEFIGEVLGEKCIGCEKCVTICPGLAITLIDYRKDRENPSVLIPFEYSAGCIKEGDIVTALDSVGIVLGEVPVTLVKAIKRNDRTVLVKLQAPKSFAKLIAGIRVQDPWVSQALPEALERLEDDTIVCRCERVTAGEIRTLINNGYRDMNEIKAVTRAGMGSCGAKTCSALILRLFREEGIAPAEVTEGVKRPLFVEVPLGILAGMTGGGK